MSQAVRVGDIALCINDAHGNPYCPHNVMGPVTIGENSILINGCAAVTMNSMGQHSPEAHCCGSNRFIVMDGSVSVFFCNKPAAGVGTMTVHCGGRGAIVTGSGNVSIGGILQAIQNASTGKPVLFDSMSDFDKYGLDTETTKFPSENQIDGFRPTFS